MLQKIKIFLSFCGAPVRPNMLNMPKSAHRSSSAVHSTILSHRSISDS